MKKHVRINYSILTWSPKEILDDIYYKVYSNGWPIYMSRSEFYSKIKRPKLLILEWWLHNIGYYLTKPFIFIPLIKSLNERFKHVDLVIKFKGEKT